MAPSYGRDLGNARHAPALKSTNTVLILTLIRPKKNITGLAVHLILLGRVATVPSLAICRAGTAEQQEKDWVGAFFLPRIPHGDAGMEVSGPSSRSVFGKGA